MIQPDKTYRKTERVLFRAFGRGKSGESAKALRQFKLDYTKDVGASMRTIKDGDDVIYDMTDVNMFSRHDGKYYQTILKEYNRRQKEETGYIYE
jgi:Mor family transcriptional regulator